MTNVFLIGDSIRNGAENSPGYGRFVEEYLGPSYKVFAPHENCRFAQYTQRYLGDWLAQLPIPSEEVSIIHWNNGLWDVNEVPNEPTPFSDLPFYVSSLRKVYHQIQRFCPNARVIFATTTSVIEQINPVNMYRRNEVIRQYNEAAVSLMNELKVEVNDLYRVSESFDSSLRSDWVHFNENGSRVFAQQIASIIMNK